MQHFQITDYIRISYSISKKYGDTIIVGGGLRTPQACREIIAAGASAVVVGTGIEKDPDFGYLRDLTAATHCKESLTV